MKRSIKRENHEAHRFPTISFIGAILISILATLWLGWSSYRAYDIAEVSKIRAASFERIKGQIIHLDEVLTMSAKMAVASGEPYWEERYRRHEALLDRAIKHALQIAPGAATAVTETQDANTKLVEMENRAFALMRKGQRRQARAILFSTLYEVQKSIYSQGMTEFINLVQTNLRTELRSERYWVAWSLAMAGLAIAISLAIWIHVLMRVKRWRAVLASEYEVRRRAEQKLAEQSALLEMTLDNMAQGFCVYSSDLKLVAFNQEYLHMGNFPSGFIRLGMNRRDVLRFLAERGDFGEGDINQLIEERIASTRAESILHTDRQRADGRYYIFAQRPMPDGGFVGTYSDITDRKKAEGAMREARDQAEFANRTKTEFLSNMSHELRTPLNAVIGFSELMMKESLGPIGNDKYEEYVTDINTSGQHLLSLINDMLDLSKIEAGKVELIEEKFDPVEVIQSCVNMVKGQARSQGLELTTEIPDQMSSLRADQRMLKQILLNLLSNAVKFTPEGGRITVKAWSQPGSGHVFQVIDSGIGVALDDIPKILRPFTQIENFLTRKHQGTGLGLPLVKNLIELQGGYLDFQSEVGVGSIVTVRFPKERIVAGQIETASAPAA